MRRIDLGPVDVRQPQVEEDEIGIHLGGADHALLARSDRGHLVAVRFEAGAERSADLGLVVDDQDLHSTTDSSTGMSKTNAVPPRTVSSTQIRPPCAVTIAFAIASPNPVPGDSGISFPR